MSRKFPKKVKRRLEAAEADRALLRKLIKAHGQWERDRVECFRENLPSYDPVDGDQPCTDKEMGDYDEIDADFAFDAQDTWANFAAEARTLLEMVSK
ncbi:hypothetical protein ACFVYF_18925 [Streptomyces sp. NPDC058274]|uniref:hypothetical protein n=1 Tax=Streptomyces sp. NPDC058274 TaxID=3346416 RepID=UPI0036E931E9